MKNMLKVRVPKKKVEKEKIGHLSKKQLKEKLKKIQIKTEVKRKKKNNSNDNIGINKHNNYTLDKYAPRKTCGKCDSVDHLSTSIPNSSMILHMSVLNMPMPSMLVMSATITQMLMHYNSMLTCHLFIIHILVHLTHQK